MDRAQELMAGVKDYREAAARYLSNYYNGFAPEDREHDRVKIIDSAKLPHEVARSLWGTNEKYICALVYELGSRIKSGIMKPEEALDAIDSMLVKLQEGALGSFGEALTNAFIGIRRIPDAKLGRRVEVTLKQVINDAGQPHSVYTQRALQNAMVALAVQERKQTQSAILIVGPPDTEVLKPEHLTLAKMLLWTGEEMFFETQKALTQKLFEHGREFTNLEALMLLASGWENAHPPEGRNTVKERIFEAHSEFQQLNYAVAAIRQVEKARAAVADKAGMGGGALEQAHERAKHRMLLTVADAGKPLGVRPRLVQRMNTV